MDQLALRGLKAKTFRDPIGYLADLRDLERSPDIQALPVRVRRLRTNSLKPERELRDAAVFCVGMAERHGIEIYLSRGEESDYDFICAWQEGDVTHYCPVQLKELVPEDLNRSATLDGLLERASRYEGVTIAVKLNRAGRFDPATVRVPEALTAAGGLWMFAALTPDQSEWALWGDFLTGPCNSGTRFRYPTHAP